MNATHVAAALARIEAARPAVEATVAKLAAGMATDKRDWWLCSAYQCSWENTVAGDSEAQAAFLAAALVMLAEHEQRIGGKSATEINVPEEDWQHGPNRSGPLRMEVYNLTRSGVDHEWAFVHGYEYAADGTESPYPAIHSVRWSALPVDVRKLYMFYEEPGHGG